MKKRELDKDGNRIIKKDAEWEHIAVVQPRDSFVGGSFEYEEVPDAKGIWGVKGTLAESNGADKVIQRYEFSPSQFTPDQAQKWLEEHSIDIVKFIQAENNLKIDESKLNKGQTRADFLFEDILTEKFERTDEGFLTGKAVITNVGVFPYMLPDGSVVRELRLPEEVFDSESVKSLKMSPLTNEHPREKVDSTNSKELSVGFVGDGITTDPYHLIAPITITDSQAIQDVQNGKRALSAGYSLDIEQKAGVWMGVAYDAIQRNIRYNHVAIVDRGRAGDDAVIRMDSIDAVGIRLDKINESNPTRKEETETMKVVKIDGVEYQAEAKVIEALHNSQEEVTSLKKDNDSLKDQSQKLQADLDSAKDKNDQLEKEVNSLKEAAPEKVDEAVKAKISLISAAEKHGVEINEDMSDEEIKKAVILKAFPNASEKLEKADSVYIQARFDSAVEHLDQKTDVEDKNKKDASDQTPPADGKNRNDGESEVDSEKSRKDMINGLQNSWKSEDDK